MPSHFLVFQIVRFLGGPVWMDWVLRFLVLTIAAKKKKKDAYD